MGIRRAKTQRNTKRDEKRGRGKYEKDRERKRKKNWRIKTTKKKGEG